MSAKADPRGASRRGSTDAADLGYTAANDAPQTTRQFLSRKPRDLPHTGCHMYQGASIAFPGAQQTWNRCPAHQPPGSVDLGPVAGWCPQCAQSPEFQAPTSERMEY
jgi:hypothetical protein